MTRSLYEAVLFDLDGVLTSTAALHARCWKEAFDPVLDEWGRSTGASMAPFGADDYIAHVDGKLREDGVRDLLASRGIRIPAGALGEWAVKAIAEHKQQLVEEALERGGVQAFSGSVRWVRDLRAGGVRTAVVSASANAGRVLEAAGISELFELTVDGADIGRLGLRGKPSPDGFLEAASRLDVAPDRAVVVEDALAGVAAGRAGGFGLVIGVARSASARDLRSAGAHVVVDDLAELAA